MRAGPERVVLREGHAFNLICLPFAGGSARSFVRLARHIPDWNVTAVQPPTGFAGAESGLDALAHFYLGLLAADLRGPGLVFGHSLGAAVAHRMVQLRADEWPQNLHVVLSAPPAPHSATGHLLALDDKELFAATTASGILPDLGASEDLALRFLLPDLRADLAILGGRGWQPHPLRAPVHLLGGHQDLASTPAALAELAQCLQPRSNRFVEGGHMYVLEQPAHTADALRAIGAELTAGAATGRAG
ncbi:thioesterase II family protein [Streptomyces sp. NPDC048416]|uniref:thioesterase II family protein n=1 Tax=Streptomyces sp. NPDC048416 TaxID=3365546 RepID=UPI003712300C